LIIVLPFPNYQLPITSLNRYDKYSTGHDTAVSDMMKYKVE